MIAVGSADASGLAATSRGFPGGVLPGQSMIDRDRERFVCSDMAMKQGVFRHNWAIGRGLRAE